MTSEVLSGRRGLMGWDEKPRDEGLLLGSADLSLGRWYGRFRRAEEWDNPLASFKWNLRLNSVGVSTVLGLYHTIPGQSNAQQRRVGMAEAAATLGMAAAIAVVMIIVCPPLGISAVTLAAVGVGMLSAGYAFSVAGRLDAGQTWGEALTGGAFDMIGLSSIHAGQTGRDIVTGRDLGLSSGERGRALILGMGQVAATAAVVVMAAYGTAAVAAGRLGALAGRLGAMAGRLAGWAGGRLAAAGRWLSGVGRTIGGWMRSAGQWMAARWQAAWKTVRTAGERLKAWAFTSRGARVRSANGTADAVQSQLLKARLAADELAGTPMAGSALKTDPMHVAPRFVKDLAADGQVFTIRGYDGVQRTLTQTLGEVNGQPGVFEWIVDNNGVLVHQRFIPGGSITGFPNQPVPLFTSEGTAVKGAG